MFLARDGQSEKARQRRRAYPIHVYVGRNGSAKSLCAVYDTMPDLDAGARCLSTVRLLDYVDPRPCEDDSCTHPAHGSPTHMQAHPGYVAFTRWEQLLHWERGPVIMDEITGVADSADNNLPPAVQDFLAQMRRADVSVRITGINWIRVNKRIREVVNAVTRCRSSLPITASDPDGYQRMWRPRRLAKWVTYDAMSLPVDDHTDHAYENAEILVKGRHWIPKSPAIRAYDTLDQVLRVGTVTEAGRCVSCGGTRRAPECSCDDYAEQRAARRVAGAQRAPRASTGTPPPPGRHSVEMPALNGAPR